MEPRTYLQDRILERLAVLKAILELEQTPSPPTRTAWAALTRIMRAYFDVYEETTPLQPKPDALPPADSTMPGLSSPARQTQQPPAKKPVDPKKLIV